MEAEERQALSIDSQLKEMLGIAERENLKIVAKKTESHSAKDSGQRKVFNEIVEDLKAGKYNAILTWNPDRLSRNAGDLGRLVDLMDSRHLVEIRTYNQIFTNSPNDKFLLMILGSQAKLENDNRGVNVQRGMRARVEMGLWPGVAPLGYLNSNLKDKACQVEIDPDRAPVIKKMFEKVAYEKCSIYDILFWLRDTGFQTKFDNKIALSTVQLVLRRPFYYGYFEYPRKSGKWYKGQHTPIITKELFDLVQDQLNQHTFKKKYKLTKQFNFLHFMKCGDCGSGVTAQEKFKKLSTGEIAIYRYYGCSHGKNWKCRQPYINEQDLISQLADMIDDVDLDLLGMRAELDAEIEKWYDFHSFVTGEPVIDRTLEKKAIDLRRFAKALFRDADDPDEQRKMLQFL